jgi:multisubunit Na+/H+ antiporter MnhB subunit
MTSTPTPGYAGFARIYWMVVGPMLLAMTAFKIASQGGGWFTSTTLVFFLVLGVLPLSRWAEFRGGSPQTAEGDPATPAHLRRYVVVVFLLGVVVWIAANAIGTLIAR